MTNRISPISALALLGLPLLVSACDPWGNIGGSASYWLEGPAWSPDVVAAIDGLYVQLPESGQLVRVTDDGGYTVVDLDGATPVRVVPTPDGEQVLVFARWPVCADEDPKIELVTDCPDEDLSYDAELAIVQDAGAQDAVTIPAHMNALAFSPDGATAVAYLDYEQGLDIDIDGIVDLTEVVFVPLLGGAPVSVSIGFSPDNILFTDDASKAVIMSRSKVVVVTLQDTVDRDAYDVLVEYPLTLDADQEVDPQDAVLTPDGDTVLVSVTGSSLLYKFDLERFSIDIEDLDAPPSDLAVSATADGTLITYASLAQLDVLSHSDFELEEPIALDDPMTGVLLSDRRAVLYNDRGGSYDVYSLDLESRALTELRVANPVDQMMLSEGGRYAVGVLRPEQNASSGLDAYQDQNWGLAVAPLEGGDEMVSLVLQSEPVGLALVEDGDSTFALLLLQGVEDLLQVDLANPSVATEVPLPAPPTGIGTLPDGRFWITHESGLGLISFLEPGTEELLSSGGFAVSGLMQDDILPRRPNEEN